MTTYLILPTEAEAQARSEEAHIQDVVNKTGGTREDAEAQVAESVTKYRWAISVGADGQTAVVIDGDEDLLTPEEQAALVPSLPDGPGDNWAPPPAPTMIEGTA